MNKKKKSIQFKISRSWLFCIGLFLSLMFFAGIVFAETAKSNDSKELFKKSKRISSVIYFVSDSDSIPADGETAATLTVLMENKKGKPLKGIKLGFTIASGEGTLSANTATTDNNGRATIELTSSTEGTVLVLVKTKNILPKKKKLLAISVTAVQTSNLVLSSDKTKLSADGTSTAKITALLRNEKNNPIIDATVEFATEKGIIPASATTDSNGMASVNLISENFNGNVVVTATYIDTTATVTIEFVSAGVINLVMTAVPGNITADGADASTITVTITDANGNPVAGETVDFRNALDNDGDGTISAGDTLDYGSLSPTTGTTDKDGVITTTLTSIVTGTIVVEASSSGTINNTTVNAVAAGEVKNVGLVSGSSSILVNGGSTAITATFSNITSGNAIFTTSLGNVSVNDVAIAPDGTASVTLIAGKLTGIAVVKVSYYDAITNSRIEGSINVTITSDTPASITVSATPDNVRAGSGQAVITALVKDADGNPVAGTEVGFTLDNKPGGTETLDTSMAVTDANGIASVNFIAGELTTPLFNGIKINAYVAKNTSVTSSTFLTISGEPFHVALVFNDFGTPLTENGDGTLSCPMAALVSDVHGNPVADGTLVSFGVATTQIVANEADIDVDINGDLDKLDKILLSSEDVNTNGILNSGEDLNGNRVIDTIEDINGNGVLDVNEDTNSNGVLDPGEDVNGNGILDIDEDINGNGRLDVNISASSIVTTSSETVDGVAVGDLRYGVNFVERFQVRLTAESGGVIDSDGQYLVLPRRDSDEGKNITNQSTFITWP
ncbi:MAG: Ig-like domain-containing protein [Candidatus Schekmanbacteria bacterium]|nr:Ig-like domain-containing protein [Candidatus Schekmanbacteria bacterium]